MLTPRVRVRALEGRTLSNSRGKLFDVVAVDPAGVRVVRRSTGKPRSTIEWWRFDRAEAAGLVRPDVTPSDIRTAKASAFNSVYLAALLRAAAAA